MGINAKNCYKSVVSILGNATAKGIMNRFDRGREQIFSVHSCSTFALFEF